MPELHKLTLYLGVLQDRGFQVALVTDGRMSGASGKVPAAIYVYPEALTGGALAKVRDGDVISLDADAGSLELLLDEQVLASREPVKPNLAASHHGHGRELFGWMRRSASSPEQGASVFWNYDNETDM
jgi:phosphogluconate dehydratase